MATETYHDLSARVAAAAVMDGRFGHHTPGLLYRLGWNDFGADSSTEVARPGEPAYEVARLVWPDMRCAGLTLGIDEGRLAHVDDAFEAASTLLVHATGFATWARKPR
jgi:hypothetical protein